jgi:hypothetical protein
MPSRTPALCILCVVLCGCRSSSPRDPVAYIQARELGWDAAGMRKDAAYTAEMVDDDFTGTSASGSLIDKAGLLRDIQSMPGNFTSFEPAGTPVVHVFGNVAIAQGRDRFVSRAGSRGENVYSDVWVRRSGGWRVLSTTDLTPTH